MQKLFAAVVLFVVGLAVVNATSIPFKSCASDAKATITSIDVTPYPAVKGQSMTVTVTGSISEAVTAGSFSLAVKMFGVQIFQTTGDICTLSPKFPCPFSEGPLTLTETATIPSIAPAGTFEIVLNATDQNNKDLLCVDLSVQITAGNAVAAVEAPVASPIATRPHIVAPVVRQVGTSIPFKTCGDGKATVTSIDASPYPIEKGQNLTVTAKGTLSETLTSGTYTVSVQMFGITVFTTSGDVCTLDPNFKCPVAPGPITISQTQNIPSIAPSGDIDLILNATDQNNNVLLCVSMSIQIASTASSSSSASTARPTVITIAPKESDNVDLSARPAVDHEMIAALNSKGLPWVAGVNRRFQNNTMADVAGLCGSRKEINPLPVNTEMLFRVMDIPTEFDARTAWPNCSYIGHIRDQGACGSCWAFGAVESMTDRICIATNGSSNPYLSAEDVISCCSGFTCGDGCNGGYPGGAWQYFQNTGVVTGGDYNTNQFCYPYQVPACDHHVTGPLQPCGNIQNTPTCTRTCLNGLDWKNDKNFGASGYSVPGNVAAIQQEIMTYGPVEGSFTVYEDFVSYKSGVYVHTTGEALGGHAIKILGWGTENNLNYWLVANSWNTDWGDQGFFKILRGVDECGIEDGIVAGHVKA